MTVQRVLIADDEPLYRQTTGELLRKAGYECVCVADGDEAIAALQTQHFDLVLSDLNMPGNFKMELLKDHSRKRSAIPIIVVTGVPSLPTAIESVRLGIADYLLKPVKFEDLLVSVRAALDRAQRIRESRPDSDVIGDQGDRRHSNHRAVSQGDGGDHAEEVRLQSNMLGNSPVMLELFDIMLRVAQSDSNILITGESGTGKEEVAQTIHRTSRRRSGLFQIIDCTAIPETLFESTLFGHKKGAFTGAINDQVGLLSRCHGGTAFLDELGELPLPLQAKLLRAVQQQTFTPLGSNALESVDTRFICATNRDLQLEVREGRFRQDLFYRLAVIHLHVPALRDRGDDILLLADFFLKRFQKGEMRIEGFDDCAASLLLNYSWPGNVRELQNVIERAIVLAKDSLITAKDLPGISDDVTSSRSQIMAGNTGLFNTAQTPVCVIAAPSADAPMPVDAPKSRDDAVRIAEREYLLTLLGSLHGNISEAARQAGISRQGMHKLLRSHDIDAASFRVRSIASHNQ